VLAVLTQEVEEVIAVGEPHRLLTWPYDENTDSNKHERPIILQEMV
jgi:hypothetical protein